MNNNYEKTLGNTGTKLNKALPAQEKKKEIQRIYIKFTALLFITNIFTYLLFSPTPTQELQYDPTQNIPTSFIELSLPLTLRTTVGMNAKKVTITDNKNNIICKEAYVVDSEQRKDELFNEEYEKHYQVFVHPKDLIKISNKRKIKLWAFPYSQSFSPVKKVKQYEVIF